MIFNKGLVMKFGLMVRNTKVIILMDKKMEKENFYGVMDLIMKDNLKIIIFMVKEYTIEYRVKENIMVNGKIIKCMGKENLFEMMVEYILVNTIQIKNKVGEYLYGQMVDNIEENGIKENNMVQVQKKI